MSGYHDLYFYFQIIIFWNLRDVSAIFFQNCLLDICDWVEAVDLAKGPIIVKALQRKHKRVEKELVPIKDVVDSFTDERENQAENRRSGSCSGITRRKSRLLC